MNKISILSLATTAALVFSPATAKDHWGNKPEFSTLDDNGDGQITKAEVQAHRAAEFVKVDIDGNGSLSAEELMAKVDERCSKKMEKRVKWMFKDLDADGTGTVELAEMQAKRSGERMFGHLDANEDGMISQEEFDAHKSKRGNKRKRKNNNG